MSARTPLEFPEVCHSGIQDCLSVPRPLEAAICKWLNDNKADPSTMEMAVVLSLEVVRVFQTPDYKLGSVKLVAKSVSRLVGMICIDDFEALARTLKGPWLQESGGTHDELWEPRYSEST